MKSYSEFAKALWMFRPYASVWACFCLSLLREIWLIYWTDEGKTMKGGLKERLRVEREQIYNVSPGVNGISLLLIYSVF